MQKWGAYVSFALYSSSILICLNSLITVDWLRLSLWAACVYALVLLLGIALVVGARLTRWGDILVPASAFSCVVSAILAAVTPVPILLIYLGIVQATLLLLFTARIGAAWHALLALIIGALVGWASGDVQIGLTATAGSALILLALNYGVHLILDHQREWKQFLVGRRQPTIRRIAWKALWIWLPAAIVIGTGLWINIQIQNLAVAALYETGLILKDSTASQETASDLHRDVMFTIGEHEKAALSDFDQRTSAGAEQASAALQALPDRSSAAIESVRPHSIDVGRACDGKGIKVWKFRIPLGWLCRDILTSVNDAIQSSFTEAKASIVQRIRDDSAGILARTGNTTAAVNDAGRKFINSTFKGARTTATFTFLLLLVSSALSNILLVCGVIGGLNLVFGRLLFDRSLSPRSSPTRPMGFRLDQGDQKAATLEYHVKNQIELTDLSYGRKGMPDWFVDLRTTRSGEGTHMRLCVPQPLSLVLRRLFSGRYLMTKVSLKRVSDKRKPTISVTGDVRMVCINVAPGQKVIFRVADLRAFSRPLKLTSVYTAHIGTHLLGLGSFYAIAEGEGHLVLASEGEQVKPTANGAPFLTESLLCWDSRAEFTLAQEPTFVGIWLNEPSLTSNSLGRSGLLDEGRPEGSGLLPRLWRLVRFLFMPF